MLKPKLYNTIKRYKKQRVILKFEALLQIKNYTMLRIRLYYSNFNSIELIWATHKKLLSSNKYNK